MIRDVKILRMCDINDNLFKTLNDYDLVTTCLFTCFNFWLVRLDALYNR